MPGAASCAIEIHVGPGRSVRVGRDFDASTLSRVLDVLEGRCPYRFDRQSADCQREGVPISLSTVADAIGLCCHVLEPLLKQIEAHTFGAERVHGDDTTVPVLAAGKTDTGRIWTYVRDDAPFGGTAPPSAMFYYSRDRAGGHPQAHLANYAGILQNGCLAAIRSSIFLIEVRGRSMRQHAGHIYGRHRLCKG